MRAAAFALLLMAAPEAQAGEWEVDPDASEIRFDYTVDGKPFAGRFARVSGAGRFEPAAPERTRLDLRIAVESLELGNPLETAFALSSGWFDAKAHPTATYRLARLTPLGGGRWEALGDVTIKDRTVIVRTPLALEIAEDRAEAVGTVAFDRLEFGLGGGIGELFVEIGREVSVSFDLVARPAGAPR